MIGGLFAFLRLVWPFVKESFFGNETFRTWLKHSKLTCVWIGMMFIMLLVMFYMIDLSASLGQREREARRTAYVLNVRFKDLQRSYLAQKSDLKLMRDEKAEYKVRTETLEEANQDLKKQLLSFEQWFETCGITNTLPSHPPNVCPVRRRPRRRAPGRPKENHNKDIINRLKEWDTNNH